MSIIEEKLKLLPTDPGVYIMHDKYGNVIYVGKAKNLKNRVKQYFYSSTKTEKVMAMVKNIADFEYIITKSEIDALSLENNLIKKQKPRYNILLKDDKTYPYLKINLKEEYPAFQITRKIKKDGSKYFGPFMGGVSVTDVLEIINQTYLLRPCKQKINANKPQKPCLNYHIHKCLGVCSGKVDRRVYMENINNAIDFLNGNDNVPEGILTQKMFYFAEQEEFEIAQNYKEKLAMLEKIKLKRITSLNRFINADIVSVVDNKIYSAVNILFVRAGRMVGGKNYQIDGIWDNASDNLMEFIIRYYKNDVELPDEIVVNQDIPFTLLEDYFKCEFNKSLSVIMPKQGARKQLIDMAENNANDYLDKVVDKINHKDDMTINACKRLQSILNLKRYPKRIECYDISNISGVDKVGSMVVFIDGQPAKDLYRKFKIKTVEGANDFESLKEVMDRRLNRLENKDEKFEQPDLIIIDGGKGQLSAVKQIFDKYNCQIDLISLAEREEEIFTLNSNIPIIIEHSDFVLRLLQRIRDEAHRFAITYFRKLHQKNSLASVLEKIDGIGKNKRKSLLEKFGNIDSIKKATVNQLMQVDGIGKFNAQNIYDYFNGDSNNEL